MLRDVEGVGEQNEQHMILFMAELVYSGENCANLGHDRKMEARLGIEKYEKPNSLKMKTHI